VPVGFDASRLLTLRVQTAGSRYAASGATIQFFEQVIDSVKRLPGVVDAAVTSQLPLSGDREEYGVRFEPDPGQPPAAAANQGYSSFRYAVSPRYLEVMGLPLRQGRTLEASDREGTPPVALLSESLARLRFGSSAAAIGRRLFIGATDGEPYTVVGVVGDVKQMSLAASQSEAVYVTTRQWRTEDRALSLVVRSKDDAMALAPAVRSAIWALDANLPIARVESTDRLLAAEGGQRRFALFLFGAFALAAVVLAAAGCYGLLASYVGERTHEIGVRSVLGATQGTIVAHVVGQSLMLAGSGVVVGVAAALIATRALATLLFGISRLDPLTYLGAATSLMLVALLATVIPARRAARIDPVATLRAQ
jgi:putative ABC transport system permease protein